MIEIAHQFGIDYDRDPDPKSKLFKSPYSNLEYVDFKFEISICIYWHIDTRILWSRPTRGKNQIGQTKNFVIILIETAMSGSLGLWYFGTMSVPINYKRKIWSTAFFVPSQIITNKSFAIFSSDFKNYKGGIYDSTCCSGKTSEDTDHGL